MSNLLQPAQAEVVLGQLSTYLASFSATTIIWVILGTLHKTVLVFMPHLSMKQPVLLIRRVCHQWRQEIDYLLASDRIPRGSLMECRRLEYTPGILWTAEVDRR
jgi:hypothetical protein